MDGIGYYQLVEFYFKKDVDKSLIGDVTLKKSKKMKENSF